MPMTLPFNPYFLVMLVVLALSSWCFYRPIRGQASKIEFSPTKRAFLPWLTSLLGLVLCLGLASPSWATAPNQPTLTVGNATVTLALPAYGNYNIKRATAWDGPYTTIDTNETYSYTDTSASNGTNYFYTITQVTDFGTDDSRESEPSEPVIARPLAAFGAPQFGRADITSTATLYWSQVPDAATYILKRSSTVNGAYTNVATGIASTTYTDNYLGPIFYRVAAVKADGTTVSADSAPINTYTVTADPLTFGGVTFNLQAGNAQVKVQWGLVSGTLISIRRRIAHSLSSTDGWSGDQNKWEEIARVSVTETSYLDTGLTNGTTYSYELVPLSRPRTVVDVDPASGTTVSRIVYDEGTEGLPQDATPNAITTTPATPVNVAAIAGDSKATITWAAANGAYSYEIGRSTSSSGPFTAVATPAGVYQSYTNTGLTNGTTYYYVVSAVTQGGVHSTASAVVAAKPDTALAAPTGVTASAGDSRIALSWNAVSGASSYYIYRGYRYGGSTTSFALIEKSTTTHFVDTEVKNGRLYYYCVNSAKSATGYADVVGSASTVVSATPVALATGPLNLKGVVGDSKIFLSWEASSSATNYQVWYRQAVGSGNWSLKSTLSLSTVGDPPSVSVTSLTNGTIYSFFVRATNGSGSSIDSNVVTLAPAAVAPVAPGAATFGTLTSTSIVVNPPALPFNASSMTFYYAPGFVPEDSILNVGATGITTTTPITVSGLTPGHTYSFRFVAINANGSTPGTLARASTSAGTEPGPTDPPATPEAPTIGRIYYDATKGHVISVFAAFPLGSSSVTAQWKQNGDPDSVFTSTGHEVTLSESSDGNDYDPSEVTGLTTLTTYVFRIAATNANGTTYGPTVSATTLDDLPAAPSAPSLGTVSDHAVVVNVPSLPTRATSLDLHWMDTTTFSFYPNPAAFDPATTLTHVTGTTTTITGLTGGQDVTIWWSANNATGTTFGTTTATTTTGSGLNAPAAPTFWNLGEDSVEVISPTNVVDLATEWSDPTYQARLYLQMKNTGDPDTSYVTIATDLPIELGLSPADPLRHTLVSELTPGAGYTFRYVAYLWNKSTSTGDIVAGSEVNGTAASVTMPSSTIAWSVGQPIACEGIRYPFAGMHIQSGTIGRLNAFAASDTDAFTRTLLGWGTVSYVTDTCLYTWTCSAGSFTEGANGSTVLWQAPTVSTATDVTFTLTVTDLSGANQAPGDTGTRADTGQGYADAPLHFQSTVQVVP